MKHLHVILAVAAVLLLAGCSNPGADYTIEWRGTGSGAQATWSYVVQDPDQGNIPVDGDAGSADAFPFFQYFTFGNNDHVEASGELTAGTQLTITIYKDGNECNSASGPLGDHITVTCP